MRLNLTRRDLPAAGVTDTAFFGVPCIQHGNSGLTLAGWIQVGCAMRNEDMSTGGSDLALRVRK